LLFYEQNPVRPASVLAAELTGRSSRPFAIAFVRMEVGGESSMSGSAARPTDPAYRGQGSRALQAENEERVRALGITPAC